VGSRRRSRKLKKLRFTFPLTCLVPGGYETHTIQVFKSGAIDFHEHTKNGIPLSIMAQEYQMADRRVESCQAFAAAMMGMQDDDVFQSPLNKCFSHVVAGDFREVAHEAVRKRIERVTRRQFIDPFDKSLHTRSLSGNVVAAKAYRILETCTFRTTSTYQHSVVLTSTLRGKTSFKGKGSELTKSVRKNQKNCFIKRYSLITVTLNVARWARVLKLCGGFVEDYAGGNTLRHFIYEIFKVKSENELYVHIMKQGPGYSLRSAKAVIRRGHDNVWRVHAWPVAWP
jgi:hypothetical protein